MSTSSNNCAGVVADTTGNPLLVNAGLPPFADIRPEHVAGAVQCIVSRSREILQQVESVDTDGWSALMQPLEAIDLLFEYGWGPVEHLLSVCSTDELRAAHESVLSQIVELRLALRQSEPLYPPAATA